MAKTNQLDIATAILSATGQTPVSQQLQVKPSPLRYVVAAEQLSKDERPFQYKNPNPDLNTPLSKSILNMLNGGARTKSIESLAFERDPTQIHEYAGIYRPKLRLTPDVLLKRIAIQDDLVAAILHARSNHIAQFGRIPEDRFSLGFKLNPKQSLTDNFTDEQMQEMQKRIDAMCQTLMTCGSIKKVKKQDRQSFAEYLYQMVRNGLMVGRSATEVIYTIDEKAERKFHSFRARDAGTIFFAAGDDGSAGQIRESAKGMLENMRHEKFDKEKRPPEEFAYIQVIEGTPRQAFTEEEMLVHNFYPVTDVEMGGYPVTPIDTMLAAVTTHINITSHNKAYFQNGRASRGMLVIKSADVNLQLVEAMKQQFNAAINGVQNSWKTPVFGCGPEDELSFVPIDQGGRDMEFQYLSDQNCRVVLSAYQMSPEELPGYSHLSRGTNNQALCLHLSTLIITEDGCKTLAQVLDGESEKNIRVWTGKTWAKARVFGSGLKKQSFTRLRNGVELKSSPDHRFRVATDEGQLGWVAQKDLKIGSAVLVGRLPVMGANLRVPEFNGHPITAEMMEILGWVSSDGCISVRFNKNTGNIKQAVLGWFYHHHKERGVWERHYQTLCEFGLEPKHQVVPLTEEEKTEIRERYGFESVADYRYKNILYNTSFVRWMLSMGFRSSADGKVVPGFVHTLPVEHKAAFLRGFFSGDAGRGSERGTPKVVIHDDDLRKDIRFLLLSMGIRTQSSEGIRKQMIDGPERSIVEGSSTLSVKDKDLFYERIGYVSELGHKQLREGDISEARIWDKVPDNVFRLFGRKCLESGKLTAHEVKLLRTSLAPSHQAMWGYSKNNLISYMKSAEIQIPEWFNDYHFEFVEEIESTFTEIEMADVEVFDDDHAFSANGIIVHNSETSNEYRLEAHRDVGIRPLMGKIEDFVNDDILPLIDPALAKIVRFKFVGLNIDTPEKESIRLQQDAPVHGTMNFILEKVEKDPIPKEMGGDIPLNAQFWALVKENLTFGQIQEYYLGVQNGSQRPDWQFIQNEMWMNWQQMQQAQQQAQMQQQQAAIGAPPGGEGGPPQGDPSGGGQPPPDDGGGAPAPAQKSEVGTGIDQLLGLMKAEPKLSKAKKKLLDQHKQAVAETMKQWQEDSKKLLGDIVEVADRQKKG